MSSGCYSTAAAIAVSNSVEETTLLSSEDGVGQLSQLLHSDTLIVDTTSSGQDTTCGGAGDASDTSIGTIASNKVTKTSLMIGLRRPLPFLYAVHFL